MLESALNIVNDVVINQKIYIRNPYLRLLMNNHKTQCMVDIASITINIVNFVIKRTDFANNV